MAPEPTPLPPTEVDGSGTLNRIVRDGRAKREATRHRIRVTWSDRSTYQYETVRDADTAAQRFDAWCRRTRPTRKGGYVIEVRLDRLDGRDWHPVDVWSPADGVPSVIDLDVVDAARLRAGCELHVDGLVIRLGGAEGGV